MMFKVHAVTGTLHDGRTLILDEPLGLASGHVRVTVEPLPDEHCEGDWLYKLQGIRQSLRERGYRPRTKQEIDEQIRTEREGRDRR